MKTLEEFAAGWTEGSLLALTLDYIKESGKNEEFLKFLEKQAEYESEGGT